MSGKYFLKACYLDLEVETWYVCIKNQGDFKNRGFVCIRIDAKKLHFLSFEFMSQCRWCFQK